MEGQEPEKRLHVRFAVVAAVVVVAAFAAHLAFAGSNAAPIGSGVVVIETNLAYEGAQAAGTGMVLTPSGEILTNNHVIRGATTIKIRVPRTGRSYTAKVLGYDLKDDVAILQANGASNLKAVSVGNSATVKRGQSVKAVGNAGGTGSLSTATGTVTGVGRSITVSDDQGGSERLTGLIETNASLQPGDSGGPLLNASGKVIGIDTAASSRFRFGQSSSGDGFAIPINKALGIARVIESGNGSATVHVGGTAFLGIQALASQFDQSGIVIAAVVPRGPAAAAGLVPGDRITSFGGHAVSTRAGLTSLVMAKKPGARVAVGYVGQDGASRTVTVTLAGGPPQ